MEIKSLENTGFDALFEGFSDAFSDYEIHFEKDEVEAMLVRRGYNPRLSFAAFDAEKIVAFTLNGIGYYNGTMSAYDTGTGTVKEYRGRGLAVEIFDYALPYLKEAGIQQYILEVLQHNSSAIAVYNRLQFATVREYDCFRQSTSNIRNLIHSQLENLRIEICDINTVLGCKSFCDFMPSWQNSFESIERGASSLTCLAAFYADCTVGYCVFDRNTGDLTQIAVQKDLRHRGIASRLLAEAVSLLATDFIKVINIPRNSLSLHGFLSSKNIPIMNTQFEMHKLINS